MLDSQTEIVKKMLQTMDEISPMIVLFKENTCVPILVIGDREQIKETMEFASSMNPDFLVTINETYMEERNTKNKTKEQIEEEINNHVYGSLAERFNNGDKSIKEAIMINAYSPDGKLSRILLKDTLKQFEKDTEEFSGFLTINDVDRVWWKFKGDSNEYGNH